MAAGRQLFLHTTQAGLSGRDNTVEELFDGELGEKVLYLRGEGEQLEPFTVRVVKKKDRAPTIDKADELKAKLLGEDIDGDVVLEVNMVRQGGQARPVVERLGTELERLRAEVSRLNQGAEQSRVELEREQRETARLQEQLAQLQLTTNGKPTPQLDTTWLEDENAQLRRRLAQDDAVVQNLWTYWQNSRSSQQAASDAADAAAGIAVAAAAPTPSTPAPSLRAGYATALSTGRPGTSSSVSRNIFGL